MASRSLVRSGDRDDPQDKNFVSSLDRFAKIGSRDSVDSILTHVYPCHCDLILSGLIFPVLMAFFVNINNILPEQYMLLAF